MFALDNDNDNHKDKNSKTMKTTMKNTPNRTMKATKTTTKKPEENKGSPQKWVDIGEKIVEGRAENGS